MAKSIGAAAAELLKERKRQGLSLVKLAERARVSKRDVSAYERDEFTLPGHPNAKTLYQIADALGLNWSTIIKMAKLEFTDGVLESLGRKKQQRESTGDTGAGGPRDMATNGQILATIRSRKPSRLRVGVINEIAVQQTRTFDLAFVNAIAKPINSQWEVKPDDCFTEEEEIDHLRGIGGSCDLVAGILETLERMALGIYVVKYPGVRNAIDGVRIHAQKEMTWNRLRRGDDGICVVTTRGDVGDGFVRSVCNKYVEHANLKTLPSQTIKAIAEGISSFHTARPGHLIAYVGAENVCHKLCKEVPELGLELIPRTKDDVKLPVYDAGLAVLHDVQWLTLLERAIGYAMRMAPDNLARIYADLFHSLIPVDCPVGHGRTYARLHSLNQPDCKRFLFLLLEQLHVRFNKSHRKTAWDIAKYCVAPAFDAIKLPMPRKEQVIKKQGR